MQTPYETDDAMDYVEAEIFAEVGACDGSLLDEHDRIAKNSARRKLS
jgi:hypothetical protein